MIYFFYHTGTLNIPGQMYLKSPCPDFLFNPFLKTNRGHLPTPVCLHKVEKPFTPHALINSSGSIEIVLDLGV
jgi:hypothetical protein